MLKNSERVATKLKGASLFFSRVEAIIRKVKALFFRLWILLIRAACVIYIISQGYALDMWFMFYCIAILFTVKPALSTFKRFRNLGSDLKSLGSWCVFILITSATAYISHKVAGVNDMQPVWSYMTIAAKTTGLLLVTYLTILAVAWFSMRDYKKSTNKSK